MSGVLEYKGYHSKIFFDTDDMILYGKIEGIRDLVTFESTDAKNIEQEFQNAVDDYLEFCEENNKLPDKEYSGSFNVRIDKNLHRQIAMMAYFDDCSLNSKIEEAIRLFVNGERHITNNSIIFNVTNKNIIKNQIENNYPFKVAYDKIWNGTNNIVQ